MLCLTAFSSPLLNLHCTNSQSLWLHYKFGSFSYRISKKTAAIGSVVGEEILMLLEFVLAVAERYADRIVLVEHVLGKEYMCS